MSAQGHTPGEWIPGQFQEPWHVGDGGPTGATLINGELRTIAIDIRGDRACRIAQCVNACAGLQDPERDVAALLAACKAALARLDEPWDSPGGPGPVGWVPDLTAQLRAAVRLAEGGAP